MKYLDFNTAYDMLHPGNGQDTGVPGGSRTLDFDTAYAMLYPEKQQPPQQQSTTNAGDGFLSNLASGFKSGVANVYGGIADILHADSAGDYLHDVVDSNQRARDYDSIFSWKYLTDPSGAAYDIASNLGSMAALAPAALALPETAAAGAATGIGRLLWGLGARNLARKAWTEAGQKAIGLGARGAATAVPESLAEGGNVRREAIDLGLSNPDARAWQTAALNLPGLMLSNGLEYALLGGKLFKPSANAGEALWKRAAMAPLRAAPVMGAQGLQNGTEELFQTTISDSALGREVGNPFNPFAWTPSQRQSFEVGAFTGGMLGGAHGAGRAMLANNPQQQGDAQRLGDYLAEGDNSLDGSGLDSRYISKWESRQGATDLQSVRPDVAARFNALAREYGGGIVITGGAEKGVHAGGPHGHEGGWKLDIDNGSISDPERFFRLCEKYGIAVGDEGNHYDLSFNANGGVGGRQVATPSKYFSEMGGRETNDVAIPAPASPAPDKSRFSEKQMEAWREAQWVQQQTGIPAEYIYRQWAHESANFTSDLAKYNNNFGGLTQTTPNGEENKQPDGGNYYRVYSDMHDYAKSYVHDFLDRYEGKENVKSMADFVHLLKSNGYFTADEGEYLKSMEGIDTPSGNAGPIGSTGSSYNQTAPLFDINAEDDATERMIADFARQNKEREGFKDYLSGMFDTEGSFQNTKENRDAIRDEYADALQAFADENATSYLSPRDIVRRRAAQARDAGDAQLYQELQDALASGDKARISRLASVLHSIKPQRAQQQAQQQTQQAQQDTQRQSLLAGLTRAMQGVREQKGDEYSQWWENQLAQQDADALAQNLIQNEEQQGASSGMGTVADADAGMLQEYAAQMQREEAERAQREAEQERADAMAAGMWQEEQDIPRQQNTARQTGQQQAQDAAQNAQNAPQQPNARQLDQQIVQAAFAPVTADTDAAAKMQQAAAIREVERQSGIKLPEDMDLGLSEGSSNAISAAQKVFRQAGIDPQTGMMQPRQTQEGPQRAAERQKAAPKNTVKKIVEDMNWIVGRVRTGKMSPQEGIDRIRDMMYSFAESGDNQTEIDAVTYQGNKAIEEIRAIERERRFNEERRESKNGRKSTESTAEAVENRERSGNAANQNQHAEPQQTEAAAAAESEGEVSKGADEQSTNEGQPSATGKQQLTESQIRRRLSKLRKQRQQDIDAEVERMKQNPGGKGVTTNYEWTDYDDLGRGTGQITRRGAVSNNPEWYQRAYKKLGRKPTKAEYPDIAVDTLMDFEEFGRREQEISRLEDMLIDIKQNGGGGKSAQNQGETTQTATQNTTQNTAQTPTQSTKQSQREESAQKQEKPASEGRQGIDLNDREAVKQFADSLTYDDIQMESIPEGLLEEIQQSAPEENLKRVVDFLRERIGKRFADPIGNQMHYEPGNTETMEQYAIHMMAGNEAAASNDLSKVRAIRVLGVMLSQKTIENPLAIVEQSSNGRRVYIGLFQGDVNYANSLIVGVEEGQDGRIVTSFMSGKKRDKNAALRELKARLSGENTSKVLYLQVGLSGHSRSTTSDRVSTENASLHPSGDSTVTQSQQEVKEKNVASKATTEETVGAFTVGKDGRRFTARTERQGSEQEAQELAELAANVYGGRAADGAFLFETKTARDEFVMMANAYMELLDETNDGAKASATANAKRVRRAIENMRFVPRDSLTAQERMLSGIGEAMGCPVVWVDTNSYMNGMHSGNVTFLNRKAGMDLVKTFWHEQFHWIKNNNKELYRQLLSYFRGKKEFTKQQLDKWRRDNGRAELNDDAVIEEMLADEFMSVAKRVPALQRMANENPTLAQRFVAWVKRMMDRVAELFHNPDGRFTTAQRDAFVKAFGKLAASMRDSEGRPLFKVKGQGRNITLANGDSLLSKLIEMVKNPFTDISGLQFSTAWHGSPHKFDRFTLDAIGSGEGAQAHGWGLYFAKEREVSEGYRDRLSNPLDIPNYDIVGETRISGKNFSFRTDGDKWVQEYGGIDEGLSTDLALDELKYFDGDKEGAIESLERERDGLDEDDVEKINARYDYTMDWTMEEIIEEYDAAIDFLRSNELETGVIEAEQTGSLLQVEIPDEDVMLDEQKRISEQPEKVQKAIGEIQKLFPELQEGGAFGDGVSGRTIYTLIANSLNESNLSDGARQASELLNEHGIKGITYDGRRDGRCYVVFDEDAIEITAKFSFAGENAETAPSETLERAKEMEKSGEGAEAIFRETGWFKGKDERWRFEIPDNLDGIDFGVFQRGNQQSKSRYLRSVYDNPALYDAYPSLAWVSVTLEDLGRGYGKVTTDFNGNQKIRLNENLLESNIGEMKKTLVHEIQHVIQKIEGFAVGGSPETVERQIRRELDKLDIDVARATGPSREYLKKVMDVDKATDKFFDTRSDENFEALNRAEKELETFAKTMPEGEEAKIKSTLRRINKLKAALRKPLGPFALYQRLGGEQEAEEAADRAEKTGDAGMPQPHKSDAIIVYGGKAFFMASATESESNNSEKGVDSEGRVADNRLRDKPEHLTESRKDTLFDMMRKHIDGYLSDFGDNRAEAARELTSENSRHRARIIGQLNLAVRDLENHQKDREKKASVVDARFPEAKNWEADERDAKIDEAYQLLIDQMKEAVDYAGKIYQEIAIDRERAASNPGSGIQVHSRADAERQRGNREGVKFSIATQNRIAPTGRSTESGFSNARSVDELKAEARAAFPNAKVQETADGLTLAMPNGQTVTVAIRDTITASDESLARARQQHGIAPGVEVTIEGYAKPVPGGAFVALAQGSREGTAFHEAYHVAENAVFTDKELADAKRLISESEEERAEAYARWRNAHGKVKDFAKLWQKIADFASRMASLAGFENKRAMFQRVESGEMWSRTPRQSDWVGDGKTQYSLNPSSNSTAGFLHRMANILAGRDNSARSERARRAFTDDMEKALGVKIRFGHTSKPGAVYKKQDSVIRSRDAYDWQSIMPAVGEVVAERLKLNATEQMKNYIADWITTRALNNTSQEARDFQAAMRANPHFALAMQEVQNSWDTLASMDNTAAMQARVQFDKPSKTDWKALKDESYDQLIEELGPVERLVARITQKTGGIKATIDPMKKFRLFRGYYGAFQALIEGRGDKAVNALRNVFPNVKWDGFKTMDTILRSIGAFQNKQRMKDFIVYCMAKHEKDLHTRNRKLEQDRARLEQKIQGYDSDIQTAEDEAKNTRATLGRMKHKKNYTKAEVQQMFQLEQDAKQWQDMAKKLRQEKADAEKRLENMKPMKSLYTEQECDQYIKDWQGEFDQAQKDLVHFSNTVMDLLVDSGVVSRGSYENMLKKNPNYVPMFRVFDDNEQVRFGDSLKEREGSTRDAINALESIIRNTEQFVRKAMQNKAKLALADVARLDGSGWLVEEVDGAKPSDQTTITFYEDGKRKYLQTDPSVVKAVNSMGHGSSGWFMKFMHAITKLARTMFTMASPEFAVSNTFRDIADANIYMKHGWVTPIDWFRGVMHAYKKDSLFYEWLAAGGAQASALSMDRDYTQSTIEKMEKTWGKRLLTLNPKNFGSAILDALQIAGEYSEYGTRLATYEKTKNALTKERGREAALENILDAAFTSRDMMDFARHGKAGKEWNQWVAFANASIQGWNKFYRAFDWRKDPKAAGRALMRLMLTGALPALALFMMNYDKKWWEEMPDFQKENNWLFDLGGHIFRVPKGQDIGIRFLSNAVEKFLSWGVNNEPLEMERFMAPLWNALPDILPTALGPVFEAQANYSFFRRGPIVPRSQERLTNKMQYGPYTTSLAKFLGEEFDISPHKAEHIINGYLGSLPLGAVRLFDTLSSDRQLDTSPEEMPFTRRIMVMPYKQAKSVQNYYDALDEQTKLDNEYKATKKRPADYDPAKLKRLKGVQKKIQELNKKERAAILNPRLSADERRKLQMSIQERRIKLAKKGLGQAQQ